MLQNIGIMKGIAAKMDWLNQRHTVISQNIANADTPNYRAHDLEEIDFSALMRHSSAKKVMSPASTNAAHMTSKGPNMDMRIRDKENVYEATPSGNSVVLEEQLLISQKNMMDYQVMTNLYRKNVGMIKTALGQG